MKAIAALALIAGASALRINRGDSFPGPILPGSEPIMPKTPAAGSDYFLQLEESSHIRHKLQHKLRKALRRGFPEDNNLIQLKDDDDTVEGARLKAAQMQAQLDQAVADADAKRAEQQKQFDNQDMSDPASQLQGLMNAQASLHRLTSAFSAKPNLDKVSGMAKNLGIPMTPELMQLGSNEAISNALVEIAVGMGKSEAEIGAALGAD